MNTTIDVPRFHIRTDGYAGAERRHVIRQAPIANRKPVHKQALDQNHPRRIAIEFACLLAAGILLGRLCLFLDGPTQVATKRQGRRETPVMTAYH